METQLEKSLANVACGLLMAFQANAIEIENHKSIRIKSAIKEIKSCVTFFNYVQNVLIKIQEFLTVVFAVSELGQINLAIAKTKNYELKKSIESQYLKISLKQLAANSIYSIQFNFIII